MATVREPVGGEAEFRAELLESGLLIDGGVPGVYGRSRTFERVGEALDALITRVGEPDGPVELRFPPVLPRRYLERVGYLGSFPHLAGTIFSFDGDEQDARALDELATAQGDWSEYQRMTDLVLTPAACYPVYPAIAARGSIRSGGVTVDAGSAYVFRNEPSGDPARLQMFRQRERVRIADPDAVVEWRSSWQSRAHDLLIGLGLNAEVQVANDPFFGRAGRMLAKNQRSQELKFEVTIPIASPEHTAVASFNYHRDHFAHVFGIEGEQGVPVHTACLGFGIERITLGLFHEHGLDPSRWPSDVQATLWP